MKIFLYLIVISSSILFFGSNIFKIQSENYSNLYIEKSIEYLLLDLKHDPIDVLFIPENILIIFTLLLFILIINFKKTIRLLLTLKLRNKTIYKEFNLNSNRNIVILSIIYLSLSIFTMFKYIEFQKPILEDNVLISHAMGEIDGYYCILQ